ncbi:MAG TPA: PEGA domain-containing protein [bacterium]|nr:PEGA domain-containing protein [bacterium]
MLPLAILLLISGVAPTDSGYLTVRSNSVGIAIYVEGDYVGRTPVEMHALKPGKYSVSIVSDDSLENVYWHLRQGNVGKMLSSVWTLAAINAGTSSVEVDSGKVTELSIDYGKVLNAPTEAKWIAFGSVGGLFIVGAAVGFLIHWLAFH